jgi:hypothetical protein
MPTKSTSAEGPDLPKNDRKFSTFLCHFSLWFATLFATPVFIAAHNPDDLVLPFSVFALIVAATCLCTTLLSVGLAALAGSRFQWWLNRILLALAFLFAIQGNFVHNLFDYGNFNGEPVDWRHYGWIFHAEWVLYLTIFCAALFALTRMKAIPAWLPFLPLISFLLLLSSITGIDRTAFVSQRESDEVDPSVFNFSSVGNLIHLLPDGLQGGVVREVLKEDPELAKQFDGFTLYTNHLGLYQGTAPAMYTILTGEPFELEKGHVIQRVKPALDEKTYQTHLRDRGYQMDFVPISPYACPDYASSCYPRPFNDMKPRGLFYYKNKNPFSSLRLIADLSIFRLVPMLFKEKIYNNGYWFLSDKPNDGTSPWPAPVIREWVENMAVIKDRPVYKWYHFIGGHIPPHWDADCNYLRDPPIVRESYKAQTACVLTSIAALLQQLKAQNIYDQTAVLISSDHGHNTVPDDLVTPPLNSGLYPGLLGSGRPTLLVKPRNNRHPLEFSDAPTSLVDVAPTALTLAEIEEGQKDVYAYEGLERRERYYTPYDIPTLWTGHPIPFVEYRVEGPVNDGHEWVLNDIKAFRPAPSAYAKVNYKTANGFVYGASLNKQAPDTDAAWITGYQLAFLLNIPDKAEPRYLQIELELPDWVKEQKLEIYVNRNYLGPGPLLKGSNGEKQTVEMALDPTMLKAGNNFFSVRFENLYAKSPDEDWQAAALLHSIKLVSGHPQS